MKQTAVQWLVEQIDNPHTLYWLREVIDKALEMERQQIIDAYVNGNHSEMRGGKVIQTISEQYYTQTFTEPKKD